MRKIHNMIQLLIKH